MVDLMGQRWIMKHGTKPSEEMRRVLAHFVGQDPRELARRLVVQLKPNANGEVWPPELADIVAMLRPKPEEFGLPSADEAYRDAVHSRWDRHAAVFETARRVGLFELGNRSEAISRREFEREYSEVCAEFMSGRTEHWPKRGERRFALADQSQPARPAWMSRYLDRVPDKFDFKGALRVLGPMPAPLKPDVPPAPVNDTDVATLPLNEREALAKVVAQKQGEIEAERRIAGGRP